MAKRKAEIDTEYYDEEYYDEDESYDEFYDQGYYQPAPYRKGISFKDVLTFTKKAFKVTGSFITGTLAVVKTVMIILLISAIVVAFQSYNESSTNVGTIGPNYPSFSVIKIEGTIIDTREAGYDHNATVRYIYNLMNNPFDRGILLYLDTPGGTLYHSDEIYMALETYKGQTGRPVYAYMASMCASGGYYISAAANAVYADRNTVTGSLGVVSSYMDVSELFEKLGVKSIVISTGDYKGAGALGTAIEDDFLEIMQIMLEESHDQFVDIIVKGRGLEESAVRGMADGRVYSAKQALELGLIDGTEHSWTAMVRKFRSQLNVNAHYPDLSNKRTWDGLLEYLTVSFKGGGSEIELPTFSTLPKGVPLVIAPEFLN